jgi:hypothetical protein
LPSLWSCSTSTASRCVCDPELQHHLEHGPADAQRAALVCAVRAGGHGREDQRQDRRQ